MPLSPLFLNKRNWTLQIRVEAPLPLSAEPPLPPQADTIMNLVGIPLKVYIPFDYIFVCMYLLF